MDESPWPVLGLKEWLWVTTGQNFCLFHPGDTRSRAELIYCESWDEFNLLINAFLPRQVVISPNLEDQKFLERYLVLSPEEYQLQMIVNLVETYNANRQRLEDVSLSLKYSAFVTWSIALMLLMNVVAAYFVPVINLK